MLFIFFLDAQEEFFDNLISKFPPYVQQNGLDPSFIYTEPVIAKSPKWSITGEFTNHQLFGHSRARSSIDYVRFEKPTDTSLGNLYLYIKFGNPTTTMEGDYKLNGRIGPNMTISGEGRWSISPASAFTVILDYEDIPLSQDGSHMDLKNAREKWPTIVNETGSGIGMTFKMEGLLAGGYEEELTNLMMQALLNAYQYNADLPMVKQLEQYFEDEFEVFFLDQ